MAGDLDSFFAELDAWATAAAWPVDTLQYGRHPDQVADLRLPAVGSEPHPVAVVLHGGFWRPRYTRPAMDAVAVALAQAGWASWNVEYRRVGAGGGVPETLEDVAAAVTALRELDAPLDRSRIAAVGHSAGGHLALWLAGTGLISRAVSLAGVCDLAEAARHGIGDGAVLDLAGGTPEEAPDSYALADPGARLPTGVPQLLVHGDRDDAVPVEHSRAYADKARAAGDPCELLELAGTGHFDVIDPRSDAWAQFMSRFAAEESERSRADR